MTTTNDAPGRHLPEATQEAEAAAAYAREHNLPQLQANTEGQLKYAELMRYRTLSKASDKMIRYAMSVDEEAPEDIAAREARGGRPWPEIREDLLRQSGLIDIYACMTETNAGKLLNAVKQARRAERDAFRGTIGRVITRRDGNLYHCRPYIGSRVKVLLGADGSVSRLMIDGDDCLFGSKLLSPRVFTQEDIRAAAQIINPKYDQYDKGRYTDEDILRDALVQQPDPDRPEAPSLVPCKDCPWFRSCSVMAMELPDDEPPKYRKKRNRKKKGV